MTCSSSRLIWKIQQQRSLLFKSSSNCVHTMNKINQTEPNHSEGHPDPKKGLWTRSCEKDTPQAVKGVVKGVIPKWLNGQLVRNGPGERNIGSSSYKHLFDGSALLHMVNIDNGEVTYTSRFLESESYKENHIKERIVFSGFGTVGVPDPCLSLFGKFMSWFLPRIDKPTDNCLVNVMQVKDQMITMTELDTVRVIDPKTLETLPDKVKYSNFVSVQRATAHPHIDSDNTAYNLGFDISQGPMKHCIVSLPEGNIEKAKVEASIQSRWKLHPAYLHSFGITENYYIIPESPLCLRVHKLILPRIIGYSPEESLKFFENENMCFRVISRKTGKELPTKFLAPAFFSFHFSNCFESEGNLVIDLCESTGNVIRCLKFINLDKDHNDVTKEKSFTYLTRYVLPVENLDAKPFNEDLLKGVGVAKAIKSDSASAIKQDNGDVILKGSKLSDHVVELPRINYKYNTKPYSFSYCSRISDVDSEFFNFDSLVKIDVNSGESWLFEDKDYYCSEPVFVSAPEADAEDDGMVLALLIHKTEVTNLSLLVLDAKEFKEVARVDFKAKGSVTSTFHGQFIESGADYQSY